MSGHRLTGHSTASYLFGLLIFRESDVLAPVYCKVVRSCNSRSAISRGSGE